VPLPEPYLLGIAAAVWLERRQPSALPGPRYLHHLTGWPLTLAGAYLIERSWAATTQVELQHPALLVTSGPYAASRNPMYLGWALLQLGAGVVRGSWWVIAAVPAAAALVHRQVRSEERTLDNAFGDEFRRYRATVPRYLPRRQPAARSMARSRDTGLAGPALSEPNRSEGA
jgi:protein-S-isoprenylcysteine O-methyltransferase Ste14